MESTIQDRGKLHHDIFQGVSGSIFSLLARVIGQRKLRNFSTRWNWHQPLLQ